MKRKVIENLVECCCDSHHFCYNCQQEKLCDRLQGIITLSSPALPMWWSDKDIDYILAEINKEVQR